MITSSYDFCGAKTKKGHSHNRYNRPVAVVVGTVRGIPFRNVFKSWDAAERCRAKHFGAEVFAY